MGKNNCDIFAQHSAFYVKMWDLFFWKIIQMTILFNKKPKK